jgi:RecA/RadA recombinase
MPSEADKVVALRRLLDERFPTVARRERRIVPTGVPAIDALLGGGLLTGTLTELVSEAPSSGSQSSLGALLLSTRLARQRIALVDAAGAFDLAGLDDDAVAHLVWVRCASLAETWRAADLVARDPNYAVVVVDVRGFPVRELLRTKDSVWVRLQRAAEHAVTALAVQSDTAVVPNAARRIVFSQPLGAASLTQPRGAVLAALAPELQRSRVRAQGGTG